ncbi:MAG TPA: alpha/beta hydrolase domain-containing protein [Acidimicrobiia bacterium]|jgi:hypothetical protein
MGIDRWARMVVGVGAIVATMTAGGTPGALAATSNTRTPSGPVGFGCVPNVEGPIAATDQSKPYVAVLQYEVPPGWVDEEYFISCASPMLTYKTTVIVRKPANPKRASGIVAVDPLHSAGLWGMMTLLQPYWVDRGDIHVGVVAGSVPLQAFVKPSNPARYDSLEIPATPEATNEILAGVGALLHQHPDALLGKAKFHAAILGGWSQTAVVTRAFIASPQGSGTIDGQPLYDGYFPGQAAVGSSGGAQVQAIPDTKVPVMELQGERELLVTESVYGTLGYRRPDSPTYRLYEVAAMSHVNNEPGNAVAAFGRSVTCEWPPGATPSEFSQTQIWDVAFDHLAHWITDGTPPPKAPRIKLEADGRTVVRDQHGNAVGGVRSVYVDVPTASIMPTSLAPGGVLSNPCAYLGYQLDFSTDTLEHLYTSHAGYAKAVAKRVGQLVDEGYLLPSAAREQIATARNSSILS